MDGVAYAKSQIKSAFDLVKQCFDGMDDAQYNFKAGGTCNTPAMSHTHSMASTDFFLNLILGAGELQWPATATANGLPVNSLEIWKHQGNIPYAPIKAYGDKIQQQVLDYIGTLNAEDLDREIDTKFFGKQNLAWVLQLITSHCLGHAGDAAAVKGMQGLKGLPF